MTADTAVIETTPRAGPAELPGGPAGGVRAVGAVGGGPAPVPFGDG